MDNLLKELRASTVLKLSGVHPRLFLTPLSPSGRASRKYTGVIQVSASQVKLLEREEEKQLFLLFQESHGATAIQ